MNNIKKAIIICSIILLILIIGIIVLLKANVNENANNHMEIDYTDHTGGHIARDDRIYTSC